MSNLEEFPIGKRVSTDLVLWLSFGGTLLGGGFSSFISLALPATQNLMRASATVAGMILVAISGVIGSVLFVQTRAMVEVETYYKQQLLSLGRTLMKSWTTLHDETDRRRKGAYQAEETYQAVVLAVASNMLDPLETIIRLCGSVGDSYAQVKTDVAAVRRNLDLTPNYDGAVEAAMTRYRPRRLQTLQIKSPCCGVRTSVSIAMVPGATSESKCASCGGKFPVHRSTSFQVFASSYSRPSEKADLDSNEHSLEAGELVEVNCPTCSASIRARWVGDDSKNSQVWRYCLTCERGLVISCSERRVIRQLEVSIDPGEVIARERSMYRTRCEGGELLLASRSRKNGDWLAICTDHRKVISLSREDIRRWLGNNDPNYLQHRLEVERAGGKSIIMNQPSDNA